jgi:hypothetical protein
MLQDWPLAGIYISTLCLAGGKREHPRPVQMSSTQRLGLQTSTAREESQLEKLHAALVQGRLMPAASGSASALAGETCSLLCFISDKNVPEDTVHTYVGL